MRLAVRRRGDVREQWSRAAKLLTAIALMLLAACLMELRFRPHVEERLAYEARLFALDQINAAMLEELAREDPQYHQLVTLEKAEDGTVTSVETNVMSVNRLKARMTDRVIRQVEAWPSQTFPLPAGSLMGSHLTAGRGPAVEVRAYPIGAVESELTHQFSSAGINQTLHQVMLKTTVQMVAVLPGYRVRTEATASFCLVETVIVGKVPESYTVVGEDGRSTVAKINDYRVDAKD